MGRREEAETSELDCEGGGTARLVHTREKGSQNHVARARTESEDASGMKGKATVEVGGYIRLARPTER